MIEPSLKAIVIGAISYSDSSKVVKVLTKEHGVLPLFVRLKKKGGTSLWHPMSVIELSELKRKTSASLVTFQRAERLLVSVNTLKDPKRTAVAFFIAEVLEKSLHEGSHIEGVFNVVEKGAVMLENCQYISNLHFYILARVVASLGLMPEKAVDEGLSFHLENGEWLDATPLISKTSYLLKNDLAELMIEIQGMEFDHMRNLKLNQSDRKELLLAMVMLIQLHHAGLREIKSYEVLETIFE